jgi:hypothetical protein
MFKKENVRQLDVLEYLMDSRAREAVLRVLLGVKRVPCLICSPLRVDKHPSFRLFRSPGGEIYYKDFSTGESGNTTDLLRQVARGRDIEDIVRFHCIDTSKGMTSKKQGQPLSVKVRPFERHDMDYWKSYGVTREVLIRSRTYAISGIFLHGDFMVADRFAYVYVEFKDGNATFKVYQPFNERYKWLSSHDKSVWELWDMMKANERKERLIITSSRKDAMCLWSHGYPAVSLQGEGYVPKASVVEEVKKMHGTVHVLYDNDQGKKRNAGREHSRRLCRDHGLYFMEIPDMYQCKDPSDLYHKYGKDLLVRVIDEQLKFSLERGAEKQKNHRGDTHGSVQEQAGGEGLDLFTAAGIPL